MRFLFINQYYAPDYAATAQQLSDLCEILADAGHEVHVVAGRSLYDGRELELPAEEVINKVHVHRVKLATGSRKRFRDCFAGYLSFYARAFMKVNRLPTADVVVTLTTPPMISLLGTYLRLTRRSRYLYWVMDVYPDIAHRAGVLSRFGPIASVWSILGRISYHTANKVVVLGNDMKQTLMRKGIPERKLLVMQSWSCGDQIYPVAAGENPFRKDCIDSDKFTIMYSGNMGTCHTFDATIEAIKSSNGEDGFQFLFIGSGKKEGELRMRLEGCKDGRVRFLPYQDRTVLNNTLSAPDAHLVTLDPRFDGLLVPSKLYGIMAAAKPVVLVGSPDNEVARIIEQARCGMRVDPDNPEALLAALRGLRDNPVEAEEMGVRGRRYFERWFERKHSCNRFMHILEEEATRPGVRGVRRLAHAYISHVTSDHRLSKPERATQALD